MRDMLPINMRKIIFLTLNFFLPIFIILKKNYISFDAHLEKQFINIWMLILGS